MRRWMAVVSIGACLGCSVEMEPAEARDVEHSSEALGVACMCESGEVTETLTAVDWGGTAVWCTLKKTCVPVTLCSTYKGDVIPPDPALVGLYGTWQGQLICDVPALMLESKGVKSSGSVVRSLGD